MGKLLIAGIVIGTIGFLSGAFPRVGALILLASGTCALALAPRERLRAGVPAQSSEASAAEELPDGLGLRPLQIDAIGRSAQVDGPGELPTPPPERVSEGWSASDTLRCDERGTQWVATRGVRVVPTSPAAEPGVMKGAKLSRLSPKWFPMRLHSSRSRPR